MRNRVRTPLLFIALALMSTLSVAQSTQETPEPLKIKAGDVAPDFTLLHYDGQGLKPVSLQDFRGKKNVVLAFYVFAFTGG